MFVSPAFAQSVGGAGGDAVMQFLPLIAIFAIMYFFMIRPQQKKAKDHRNMVENLRRKDIVITAGGLKGKVTNVLEEELEIEIADGVRVRVIKSTITQVVSKTEPVAEA